MLFRYTNILPYDVDELISYIGQENILKLVFEDVSLDKYYYSPFRDNDNTPGCYFIKSEKGRLIFVDFADPERTHYDCVQVIMKKNNCTFIQAINIIRSHFEKVDESILSKGNFNKEDTSFVPSTSNKKDTQINLLKRDWDNRDKEYWSEYGINRRQLEEDGVVPIEMYSVTNKNGEWVSKRPNIPTYAYIFDNNKVKIYSPYADNIKYLKWITNCSNIEIGNIKNISEEGEVLIITKSYKDCRVLRNLGYNNSIWLQSESAVPEVEDIVNLGMRFKKIYVLFDSDDTGIAKTESLKSFINEFFPNKSASIIIDLVYNTKDISDMYKKYGKDFVEKFLKEKIK